jgi:hypothetical protein
VPRYRVYRIKESPKEHFRWSAHTGGLAIVKARDYEPGGEVESATPYALWKELQDPGSPHSERPLSPGDLLETIETEGPGRMLIAKYIGFEPAQWFVPEIKAAASSVGPNDNLPVPQCEGALQG